MIANQPTRGIDVGANEFIWKKIIEQRDAKKGILLISADLNEVLELSDSIIVMCDGEVAAYLKTAVKLQSMNWDCICWVSKNKRKKKGEGHNAYQKKCCDHGRNT